MKRIAGILFALTLVFTSCSKQKAEITVHYLVSNESGFDLGIKTTKSYAFELPHGTTDGYTEIVEGIDYNGSCNFDPQINGIITISYREAKYDYEIARARVRGFLAYNGFQVHKDAPREYTVRLPLSKPEIADILIDLGVWVNEEQYASPN